MDTCLEITCLLLKLLDSHIHKLTYRVVILYLKINQI
nr:MAG TPA: hypothetical protein [Caudoviricetes sp.]